MSAATGPQEESVIQFDHYASSLIEADERAEKVYEWLHKRVIYDDTLLTARYLRNTRNYPEPEPDGVFRVQERWQVFHGHEMHTRPR